MISKQLNYKQCVHSVVIRKIIKMTEIFKVILFNHNQFYLSYLKGGKYFSATTEKCSVAISIASFCAMFFIHLDNLSIWHFCCIALYSVRLLKLFLTFKLQESFPNQSSFNIFMDWLHLLGSGTILCSQHMFGMLTALVKRYA